MSVPRETDILFRTGGTFLKATGRPFIGYRRDGTEPEAYTFARADSTTCATYIDQDGNVRTAAAGKLRASWYDTDLDGTQDVCGLLLESSRTNLCLYSQDFSNWTAAGTPTITSAALMKGILTLDLIGDDAAGTLEFYSRNITFTGDAVKAVSVRMYPGTSVGSVIRVVDSGAAERLSMTVAFTGSGTSLAPSVTPTTGTYLGYRKIAAGIMELWFQTTSVTAANTPHIIQVMPASNAALSVALTGNVYVGGVQIEDAPYPSSYIKTTSATVTRAADVLRFPLGFPPSDGLTVYAKLVRPPHADASGTLPAGLCVFELGAGSSADWRLDFVLAARQLQAQAAAGGAAQATANIPAGNILTVCAQSRNWSTGAETNIDVGSGFGSWATSGGNAATSTWSSSVIRIGNNNSGIQQPDILLADFIVARGLFTLTEMAACPTP